MFARQVYTSVYVFKVVSKQFSSFVGKGGGGVVFQVTVGMNALKAQNPRCVKCSWLWDLYFSYGPNFSPSKVSSDRISVQSKHVMFDLFLLEMLLFSAPQLLLI